jgi:hypothetical protein
METNKHFQQAFVINESTDKTGSVNSVRKDPKFRPQRALIWGEVRRALDESEETMEN